MDKVDDFITALKALQVMHLERLTKAKALAEKDRVAPYLAYVPLTLEDAASIQRERAYKSTKCSGPMSSRSIRFEPPVAPEAKTYQRWAVVDNNPKR